MLLFDKAKAKHVHYLVAWPLSQLKFEIDAYEMKAF